MGDWIKIENLKGFEVNKTEILNSVREAGASVPDEATVLAFVDDNSIESFAINGDDGVVFFDGGHCFCPDPEVLKEAEQAIENQGV